MNCPQFESDMTLFSNRRSKRNTACLVLLLWLFALASGVANACLLDAPRTTYQVVMAGSSGTDRAISGHGDFNHSSSTTCLKVCDDNSRSLPKPDSGIDQADPGPAPVVAVLWNAAIPMVPVLRTTAGLQPATAGLPVRIRYVRLAL